MTKANLPVFKSITSAFVILHVLSVLLNYTKRHNQNLQSTDLNQVQYFNWKSWKSMTRKFIYTYHNKNHHINACAQSAGVSYAVPSFSEALISSCFSLTTR